MEIAEDMGDLIPKLEKMKKEIKDKRARLQAMGPIERFRSKNLKDELSELEKEYAMESYMLLVM